MKEGTFFIRQGTLESSLLGRTVRSHFSNTLTHFTLHWYVSLWPTAQISLTLTAPKAESIGYTIQCGLALGPASLPTFLPSPLFIQSYRASVTNRNGTVIKWGVFLIQEMEKGETSLDYVNYNFLSVSFTSIRISSIKCTVQNKRIKK